MKKPQEIQQKRLAPKEKRGTALTFTPEELMELAKYTVAGMVLLQIKPSVAARIKGALSRLGLQPPAGL